MGRVHRSLNVAERSPDVRSVVITGAGGMFCSAATCSACRPTASSPRSASPEH